MGRSWTRCWLTSGICCEVGNRWPAMLLDKRFISALLLCLRLHWELFVPLRYWFCFLFVVNYLIHFSNLKVSILKFTCQGLGPWSVVSLRDQNHCRLSLRSGSQPWPIQIVFLGLSKLQWEREREREREREKNPKRERETKLSEHQAIIRQLDGSSALCFIATQVFWDDFKLIFRQIVLAWIFFCFSCKRQFCRNCAPFDTYCLFLRFRPSKNRCKNARQDNIEQKILENRFFTSMLVGLQVPPKSFRKATSNSFGDAMQRARRSAEVTGIHDFGTSTWVNIWFDRLHHLSCAEMCQF